jgi:hypothetical protein
MAEYKIGEQVGFKNDTEGHGTIVEIDDDGYSEATYIIAVTKPGSRNSEPTHIMARYNNKHECMTVLAYEDKVWND